MKASAQRLAAHGMSNGPTASKRRRILVLAPRNPYPVNGGDRLRIHRLARALSSHYDLTLVTFCRTAAERDAPPPGDGVFKKVHRIVLPAWRSWLNTLKALPTSVPLEVAYYKSAEFQNVVSKLAPSHDAVLAHLVRTAHYTENLKVVRILEMTDAISLSMKRIARLRGCMDIRRLLYAIEARRLPAYDLKMAASFDSVLLTSMVDRQFLFDVSKGKFDRVMIVPNGVDPPLNQPLPISQRNPGEIVFVGHMHSLPNFDAVWNFAKHVLPLIRSQRPDAYLRVIGPIRPFARYRLSKLPGVRVEGLVPSISVALATARVGVCPTRAGAGINNKNLDYMSNGLAVVSSSLGNEGLNAKPDDQLLIADTRLDWSAKVLRLLADDELAQRLADAGRDHVVKRHRWGKCMAPVISRLEALLPAASQKTPTHRKSAAAAPRARTGT